jgi:hypothetical protein
VRGHGERFRSPALTLLGGLVPLASLAACAAEAPPEAAAPDTTCPIPVAVAAPTFGGVVLPMLRATCGAGSATSWHGSPTPVGHVSYAPGLTATEVWAQLVDVEPSNAPTGAGWRRIAPNDPARSWLVEKVTKDDPGGVGQAYGNRMPYGLPNLCAATVETLVAWIQRGAPND